MVAHPSKNEKKNKDPKGERINNHVHFSSNERDGENQHSGVLNFEMSWGRMEKPSIVKRLICVVVFQLLCFHFTFSFNCLHQTITNHYYSRLHKEGACRKRLPMSKRR